MAVSKRSWSVVSALLTAALLSACGGGGGGASGSTNNTGSSTNTNTACVSTVSNTPAQISAGYSDKTKAPTTTNNIATDGYNWINYRRVQTGLPALDNNSAVAAAAQHHSSYQNYNNVVSHNETPGALSFTGCGLSDRLQAVSYNLSTNDGYAYGEVISAATTASGFELAENLFTAIYHRFVMLEPNFKEGGAGASTSTNGYAYFTADLTANHGYPARIANGSFVTYPFDMQSNVPINFFSNTESPDPVPNQDEVGYPVSVHTNIDSTITVQTFTIRPRGGSSDLTTQLLSNSSNDPKSETPQSGAAIIPLARLQAGTIYDVVFNGKIDTTAVTRTWSFTTH